MGTGLEPGAVGAFPALGLTGMGLVLGSEAKSGAHFLLLLLSKGISPRCAACG